MNRASLALGLFLLLAASNTLRACEFKPGETKFLDYANCRYGADNILVVDLPEGSAWQHCIYHLQAFRPEALLAVTRQDGGKEILSLNDRSTIGNPCYMAKNSCDAALRAYNETAP